MMLKKTANCIPTSIPIVFIPHNEVCSLFLFCKKTTLLYSIDTQQYNLMHFSSQKSLLHYIMLH